MRAGLLNLTCKKAIGLESLGLDARLLHHPFHRAISRTDYRADLFRYAKRCESIAELKKMPRSGRDWETCATERARALLDLKREKYILSYSGGIDSTCMLAAFLQVANVAEKKKVVLYMSGHSVLENPSFYSKYLAEFPWRSSMEEISGELLSEDALFVTGELGDQLFGADLLAAGAKMYGDEILHADYRVAAPKIIELQTRVCGTGAEIFKHFDPIVKECPFPVRSAHDFFWWFNFTQKWQHVKYRFVTHTSWDLRAGYGTHIQHFYDDLHFQLWSLENHDQKIQKSWSSYKYAAKEFLYTFTKDEAQRRLVKIQSLEKTFLLSQNRIAVDEENIPLSRIQDLEAYVGQ